MMLPLGQLGKNYQRFEKVIFVALLFWFVPKMSKISNATNTLLVVLKNMAGTRIEMIKL